MNKKSHTLSLVIDICDWWGHPHHLLRSQMEGPSEFYQDMGHRDWSLVVGRVHQASHIYFFCWSVDERLHDPIRNHPFIQTSWRHGKSSFAFCIWAVPWCWPRATRLAMTQQKPMSLSNWHGSCMQLPPLWAVALLPCIGPWFGTQNVGLPSTIRWPTEEPCCWSYCRETFWIEYPCGSRWWWLAPWSPCCMIPGWPFTIPLFGE